MLTYFPNVSTCEPCSAVHSAESSTPGNNYYVWNIKLRLSFYDRICRVWWLKTIVKSTLPHFAWNWELDNGKFKPVQKWSLSFCAKVQQFVLFRWTSGQKLKVRIRNFPGTGIANSLLYAPPWPGLKETSSGLCINLRFITPPFTPPFGCNFWMTYKRHTIFQE